MPSVTKDEVKIINATDYATLAHGETTDLDDCTPIDLTKAASCVLAVRAGTIPDTVTINLYASSDGVTYDDVPWSPNTAWASGWTNTTTVENEHSPEIPVAPKYIKITATNDDGADPVLLLEIYSIVQTVG